MCDHLCLVVNFRVSFRRWSSFLTHFKLDRSCPILLCEYLFYYFICWRFGLWSLLADTVDNCIEESWWSTFTVWIWTLKGDLREYIFGVGYHSYFASKKSGQRDIPHSYCHIYGYAIFVKAFDPDTAVLRMSARGNRQTSGKNKRGFKNEDGFGIEDVEYGLFATSLVMWQVYLGMCVNASSATY